MRMWMVDTRILCRKHLLGEHVENHMFVASMHKSLHGYVKNNLLEVTALPQRHADLEHEMYKRGYNHGSPFDEDTYNHWLGGIDPFVFSAKVDTDAALYDLLSRCNDCQARYENLEYL